MELTVCAVTGDEPAERVLPVHGRAQQVVYLVVGLVVVHGDLLEDHATLGLHVRLREYRRGHQVAHHVDGQRQVSVEYPGVVAGVLPRGERVGLPADRLDLGRYVQRGTPPGALDSRCSRKCETPDSPPVSSLEPTLTQMPNDTLRIAGSPR